MKKVALLILAMLALAFAQPTAALCQTAAPDHITLTWTADPATTQTVTWRTDATVKTGDVRYSDPHKFPEKTITVKATMRDFVTDLGPSHLFTATLTGLGPGRRYSYSVGDSKNRSKSREFDTFNPKLANFKFLVFGDSQSGARETIYGPWHDNLQAAYKANPDARFIVNIGDLVEVGQSMAHWNSWFDAAKGVIDTIPEMAVQGNHETYNPDPKLGSAKPDYWIAQFALPQNGPAGLKDQVYSYNYGPVHFVVLDSQQDEEKPKYGDILESQKKWLDADLSASKATWKIVFFHKTPYSVTPSRDNKSVKDAFCPVLERHHVDVVFNGHDHAVSRTYAIKNDVFMDKPSKGTIYYIAGRSGAKTYPILLKKPFDTFFYNPLDEPNYMVVRVSGKRLTIEAFKQDGALIDSFFIDKAKDVDSDTIAKP